MQEGGICRTPPGTGVEEVLTWSVVVLRMDCPEMAACRMLFGFFTMSWVTPERGRDRKVDATERSISVKVCAAGRKSPFGGGVPPMPKGIRLLSGRVGPPSSTDATPWARIVVPCGMDAILTTVGCSAGSAVWGTAAQIPGSMWRPSPLEESEICCM